MESITSSSWSLIEVATAVPLTHPQPMSWWEVTAHTELRDVKRYHTGIAIDSIEYSCLTLLADMLRSGVAFRCCARFPQMRPLTPQHPNTAIALPALQIGNDVDGQLGVN
jgi:hypothetical protein